MTDTVKGTENQSEHPGGRYLGYVLAFLALHGLSRSDVARVDGLRSVAGAFTLGEVAELTRQAGITKSRLQRCWPQRYTLSWRGP